MNTIPKRITNFRMIILPKCFFDNIQECLLRANGKINRLTIVIVWINIRKHRGRFSVLRMG